jgi:hypothetical protein
MKLTSATRLQMIAPTLAALCAIALTVTIAFAGGRRLDNQDFRVFGRHFGTLF